MIAPPVARLAAIACTWLLTACTTTTVNEHREITHQLQLGDADRIVVLGRRHAGHYETEPDFIRCIGQRLSGLDAIEVMDEKDFINSFYPWFEPRTAPLTLQRLELMLRDPLLANRVHELGVRYMIWVDGNTETTDSSGSVSCAVAPGAGGCFGFATWDKTSNYEAVIWDVADFTDKGRVRVDAEGSSYLLAIGAPIPFIARVQGEACQGIGNQLRTFFADGDTVTGGNQP
ncbi:MAG: hypothetical protein WC997_18405 [Porticoccaceae bacterium]